MQCSAVRGSICCAQQLPETSSFHLCQPTLLGQNCRLLWCHALSRKLQLSRAQGPVPS